ncbi:interferon regulatory factor 8 isoform X2 [Denticeps clupeoides]|uniref:interferon regulatory factor 8 isoform X2 n=1 Tax=Denticeps clupeoides TaxID=299321 RepID=UPI0010A2DCA0|nr:interferon regulatory factor 8 isoform X2 [Denticeps clupeoides]
MTLNPGGRRLKQWLVEQINSNLYSGLQWEDEYRTMFRIPWKHAGKQDYNQEIDASIFKAWAIFKGKFKEGDKAEPATWKTRLRCALNKSPDFEEVTDRSQLDISEPYKVYRIVPEEEQKSKSALSTMNTSNCANDVTDMDCSPADLEELIKETSNDDYLSIIKRSHSPLQGLCIMQPMQEWWDPETPIGHPIHRDSSQVGSLHYGFSQMVISFYYAGMSMGCMMVTHPEGCRLSACQPPVSIGLLHEGDSLQNICFPSPDRIENERQRQVTRKLFGHLERGVLLRANREGIFIKRLCQSRVFWSSLGSQYSPEPCKLERDAVVKIFDTNRFLQALQLYRDGHLPAPDPNVTLCFGEEFHDISMAKSKLIIVQITTVKYQQLIEAVNDVCSYSVPQHPSCFRDNLAITA